MDKQKGEDRFVKIILLGEPGVGKTSIINRYINNEYNEDSPSTYGSSFTTKVVIKDNIKYFVNVWDTSGQEKYRSVTNLFINGSNIVILVYAINSKQSFEGLEYWYNTIKEKLEGDNYILAVVGSKIDLIDNEVVQEEEAKKFANSKNALFKLVSSKQDPEGIEKLFKLLLEELIKEKKYDVRGESIAISRPSKLKKQKKACC